MANTLKFGNGNWATKDGSTLAYNDESGFNPLPFDFTRASSATVVNKNGLIETVASGIPRIDFLGNTKGALLLEPARTNLIAQSQAFGSSYWAKSGASIQGDPSTAGAEQVVNGNFATDSDWTKGTGWTVSGGKANASATTGQLYQATSTTVNTQYKIEYTISNYVSGTYNFLLRGGSTPAFSGNGTFTVYLTSGSGVNSNFIIDGVAAFTGSIDNVSIKEVQGFASPSADSPLGAFKLVEDTSTGEHIIYKLSIGFTSGATLSYSFFAKKGERNVIQTYNYIGGGYQNGADFDLSTGIVSNKINGSGTMLELDNGWYRCEFTSIATVGQSATNVSFRTLNASGQNNYTGDGTSGVYIYGAQLEAGSYATSLINTFGSAVTRQADVCDNGGNSEVINSTEGVLYFEGSALADDGTDKIISLNDNTVSNRLEMKITSSGSIAGRFDSASSDITLNTIGISTTDANKIALYWTSGKCALWINGVKEQENLTFNTFPTNSLIKLDFYSVFGGGISNFYGETKDIRVYNTALTDAELQSLTSL